MQRWIYIALLTLLLWLLFSCEQAVVQPFEQFIIPKGTHAKGLKAQSLQSQSLRFDVIFDESAVYTSAIPENQHDINKLYGFSDCNSHHHTHSARFGWRWLDGELEIHAYVYADGERTIEYVGTVPLHEPRAYELTLSNSYYHFHLQGFDPVKIERKAACKVGLYYMLFPYFGGDEVAPHDILIQILTKY